MSASPHKLRHYNTEFMRGLSSELRTPVPSLGTACADAMRGFPFRVLALSFPALCLYFLVTNEGCVLTKKPPETCCPWPQGHLPTDVVTKIAEAGPVYGHMSSMVARGAVTSSYMCAYSPCRRKAQANRRLGKVAEPIKCLLCVARHRDLNSVPRTCVIKKLCGRGGSEVGIIVGILNPVAGEGEIGGPQGLTCQPEA